MWLPSKDGYFKYSSIHTVLPNVLSAACIATGFCILCANKYYNHSARSKAWTCITHAVVIHNCNCAIFCWNYENCSFGWYFWTWGKLFWSRRVRGKRGRGAAGKTLDFGFLKRGGEVYVEVVKNYSREQLMPIIQGKILKNSTIHTDGLRAYDDLSLNGHDHYRVYD